MQSSELGDEGQLLGKYDPLHTYLRRQHVDELVLTFTEIERLVGLLPKSAQRGQWWANETSADTRHVQCRAWPEAKRNATLVDGKERVIFRRQAARAVAPE